MIKYILILVLFLASLNANAQLSGQAKIDSFEVELPKAKQDTNHVNLLNSLSYEYSRINPDKGIEYGLEGAELAKKLGRKKGEANCYNSLGTNYIGKSDYPKALEYYHKALIINEELGNKSGIARNFGNMGVVYNDQSDYPKALEYYHKALKMDEELENKNGVASNLGNIGTIYVYQSDYPKALEYLHKALKIFEELGDKNRVATNLGNIGLIYAYQSDYPKALEYYQKALRISEELGNNSGISLVLGNIGLIYRGESDFLKSIEYHHKALILAEELGKKSLIAINLANIGELYIELSQDSIPLDPSETNKYVSFNKEINLNRSIDYLKEAIEIYEEIGELDNRSFFLKKLSDAYKQKGNYKEAYEAHVEFKTLQDSVFNMDKSKEIATLTATREKEVAEKELKIQKLENIRRRNESYALYGGLALFAVVLFVIYRQRKRSEKLLLNILPAAIAKRLKAKEHPIADHFEEASVVFIDIVKFTDMASDASANRVVEVLNIIFTKFDEIAAKHKLEKIKTIGDSYMAVTGVPITDPEHAKNMSKFALEVKAEMNNYRTEDDTLIQFRIGIDCGDVVAGVIGSNKFIYDLWGDTVNSASRMESNGTPDEIHVTGRFRDTLVDSFQFEERGEMDIKGKGMMRTYYLMGEK